MIKWFIKGQHKVSGPHTTEALVAQVDEGQCHSADLIWCHLQEEWLDLQSWKNALPKILKRSSGAQEQWHYAFQSKTLGPMSRADLVEKIADIKEKKDVLIWTKGMKDWAPFFEFHEIIEDLGHNRREQPRALIDGSVIIKTESKTIIGALTTIGSHGFGAKNLGQQLKVGQVIHADLKSDRFPDRVRASATVRYITPKGQIGFEFDQINRESQAMIIEYVKSVSHLAA